MILAIAKNGMMIGGLFSTARLRDSYANPVFVRTDDDCVQLLRLFHSYFVQTRSSTLGRQAASSASAWVEHIDALREVVARIDAYYSGKSPVTRWTKSIETSLLAHRK